MLNFCRSTVKHGTRNIQNDCHQCFSDSFRVQQIRFRPGLRSGPRWESLQRSLRSLAGLRGHTFKGKGGWRGKREKGRGAREGRALEGPASLTKIPRSAPGRISIKLEKKVYFAFASIRVICWHVGTHAVKDKKINEYDFLNISG